MDFGDVYAVLAGVKTKCQLFAFRLSHSGRAVQRVYPTTGQEAFLEGHIAAFETIGGIPTKQIKYDNLSDAVTTVIYGTGRRRTENPRWVLFRSHYGFDAFYCLPEFRALTRRAASRAMRRVWAADTDSGTLRRYPRRTDSSPAVHRPDAAASPCARSVRIGSPGLPSPHTAQAPVPTERGIP